MKSVRARFVPLLALLLLCLPRDVQAQEVIADYPIPNGRFFSQASGTGPAAGYSVSDDGGQAFFSEFGRLDVLVNCAGGAETKSIMKWPDDDFENVLALNFKASGTCRRRRPNR